MGKAIRESFLGNTVGKKFETGTVYLSTEQEDTSYQCRWTISNWQGRKIDSMWKLLMKEVNLGEPTSFPDHVHVLH